MDVEKLIADIDQYVLEQKHHLNGVVYGNMCTLAAKLCFLGQRNEEGIYYLSEAHGAPLRVKTLLQRQINLIKLEGEITPERLGLPEKYIAFDGTYAENKYQGLLSRLRELPKEWTLIQITRDCTMNCGFIPRKANTVPEMVDTHIVRYRCGVETEPCHVLVPKPIEQVDGTVSILQLIYESVLDESFHLKSAVASKIRQKREENSHLLSSVVRDIQTQWLRKWSCLLLGQICDRTLEQKIFFGVTKILTKNSELSIHDKNVIYQIANGCAHLNEEIIEEAVSDVVQNKDLRARIIHCILSLKTEFPDLASVKRYPVILLVDEFLQCIPWEVLPILQTHPVSRLPSVHFVHALFKKHEETIVNGYKIIPNSSLGFYVVNPDATLSNTDKRVVQFLQKRCPEWSGLVCQAPSEMEFINALTKHEIFLYCGHGSGTVYLKSSKIEELNVTAIPMLFGCSSLAYKDQGGVSDFFSLSNSYLMAASPCTMGMLWTVTSTDTDFMALNVLNHWLPGQPVDLKEIEGFDRRLYPALDPDYKETELLRLLTTARHTCICFTNTAAFIAYGIPIKVKDS